MYKFKKIIPIVVLMLLLASCTPAANNGAVDTNNTAANNTATENVNVTDPVDPEAEDTAPAADMPAPSDTEGDYSAEASNINNTNLKDYLNRDDTVYIDIRDYEDYTKKHFKNFEVIPYFAYIHNEQAGTEGFPQLYGGTPEEPVATYESSDAILEALFPKDKNLVIVCQAGGRVTMLMNILENKGYDMSKVYNAGGMAQYTGEEFRELITDTEELGVESNYTINATPAAAQQ